MGRSLSKIVFSTACSSRSSPARGRTVAHGIDHLLLPQLACEVVAFRSIDIAVACIRQRSPAVEVLPALVESVMEQEIEEASLAIDVDPAQGIDDLFERSEVDPHIGVH